MPHRIGLTVAAVVALAALATPSSALLVQPIYLDMRDSGARSNTAIRVVNDRNRPISVEVSVNSLTVPEQGEVVYTPIEGEDFLIFPAIGNIPANGTQIFRVRWIGEPVAQTQLYALTSTELPVVVETDSKAAIQVLYAINTVVAIGPSSGRSEITAAGVERHTNADGKAGVRVLFDNAGALHGRVSDATLTLRSGDWRFVVDPALMGQATGLGFIPANGRRYMFIEVPGVPPEGELTVDLNLPSQR